MKFLYAALLVLGFSATLEAKTIKLTSDNTVILNGPVDSKSVSAVIEKARQLDSEEESKEPIYLFLYTPGGSIQDGIELIETLQSLNRPVHTISLNSASMGFQIVQGLDHRYVLKGAMLMSHKAHASGVSGEFGDGKSQLDNRLSVWVARMLELDLQTVKRTKGKQTLKSYRAAYENELWLTGSQAVKQGYADQVVRAKCDKSLTGEYEQVIHFMGIPITLYFSNCPLNTNMLRYEIKLMTNRGIMNLTDFQNQGGVFVTRSEEAEGKLDLYSVDKINVKNLSKLLVNFKENYEKNRTKVIYMTF